MDINEFDLMEWTDDLSVNVRVIDEQHKEVIRMINELYEAIKNKEVATVLGKMLEEIAEFENNHFLLEENYFEAFSYQETEQHKAAHLELKGKIDNYIERYKINDISVLYDFISFLNGYLEDHLVNMDKGYTKCFNEHGLY